MKFFKGKDMIPSPTRRSREISKSLTMDFLTKLFNMVQLTDQKKPLKELEMTTLLFKLKI